MKIQYYFDIEEMADILFDHLDGKGMLPVENVTWDVSSDLRLIIDTDAKEDKYMLVLHMEKDDATPA